MNISKDEIKEINDYLNEQIFSLINEIKHREKELMYRNSHLSDLIMIQKVLRKTFKKELWNSGKKS